LEPRVQYHFLEKLNLTINAIYLSFKNSFFSKAVDKEGDVTPRYCNQGSQLADIHLQL
jgi:hypothetical protein